MTPKFLEIPAFYPISIGLIIREPPEDLQIVREIYKVQKARIEIGITVIRNSKRNLQQALIALSFLGILLANLLQIYVTYLLQSHFAVISLDLTSHSPHYPLNLLIFLCSIFWGFTTILVVIGVFKFETYDYPSYLNVKHIEADFLTDVYNPFKWYKETIILLQGMIEELRKNRRTNPLFKIISITRFALGFTAGIFVLTFIWIIFNLPHILPLN